jgi:hypothetical protein
MSVYQRRKWTHTTFTTNAVVNTTTNHTMLAAPGAGLRYRIYAVGMGKISYTAGSLAANLGIRCTGTTVGALIFALLGASPGRQQDFQHLGDVGYPVDANTVITYQSICDVASQNFIASIVYAIEASQ